MIAFQGEPAPTPSGLPAPLSPGNGGALHLRGSQRTRRTGDAAGRELDLWPAGIDILLPESGLHIIDEGFVRVRISLMGVPGAKLARHHRRDEPSGLWASAAASCAATGFAASSAPIPPDRPWRSRGAAKVAGALAAPLAAEIYGLDELASDVGPPQQYRASHHVAPARFQPPPEPRGDGTMMTSFVFRVPTSRPRFTRRWAARPMAST